MFRELNDLINFKDELPNGHSILVTGDDQSDAGFILHYILTSYLKRGKPIILVNVHQSFSHFHQIASKAGFNLKVLKERGQILSVDCLKATNSLFTDQQDPTNPMHAVMATSFGNVMKPIFEAINKCLDKITDKQSPLVVIDDITTFLALGATLKDVCNFAFYVSKLVCEYSEPGCLAIGSTLSPVEDESCRLLAYIKHLSDYRFIVNGLATGFSKAVHGELCIERRTASSQTVKSEFFQFNLQDRNVQIFAHGTSSAVL